MRRFTFLLLLGSMVAMAGCTSPARFVDRTDSGGIVAVPDYSHRDQAIALIHREVGPNYHITDEKEVVVGSDTKTTVVAGSGSLLTRFESWFTGTKQVAKSETKTEPEKEFRITYIKTTPLPPASSPPSDPPAKP